MSSLGEKNGESNYQSWKLSSHVASKRNPKNGPGSLRTKRTLFLMTGWVAKDEVSVYLEL